MTVAWGLFPGGSRSTKPYIFRVNNYAQNDPNHNRRTHKVPFIAGRSHFPRKTCAPKQSPCNSHAAIKMRFAAARTHPCSHSNAICIHTLQGTKREPITPETIQTATAADARYPSSPPAATLHRNTQGFVLRLPPENKPQATFMRPFECVVQQHVHIHAIASPMVFCNVWMQIASQWLHGCVRVAAKRIVMAA